jgi:hypothetical protein
MMPCRHAFAHYAWENNGANPEANWPLMPIVEMGMPYGFRFPQGATEMNCKVLLEEILVNGGDFRMGFEDSEGPEEFEIIWPKSELTNYQLSLEMAFNAACKHCLIKAEVALRRKHSRFYSKIRRQYPTGVDEKRN